jgi:hypothetical protein
VPSSKQLRAALSHCWGFEQVITTTAQTLTQHRKGIHHSQLPKTFRDAVEVAQQLHLRYLRIDSLCIIQNDSNDWSRESAMMSKVYDYAHVTISASGAENGTEGCFWERSPRSIMPTESSIHWSNCQPDSRMRYDVVPEALIWTRKLDDEPLNKRAWVLQERLLSRRVLHFSREQIYWECRDFSASESYLWGVPTSLREDRLISTKSAQLDDGTRDDRWPTNYVPRDRQGTTWMERLWYALTAMILPMIIQQTTLYAATKSASIYRDWDEVVEQYTQRDLTFPTGKLEALSGIARVLSETESSAHGDGYLAGLWQSSFPVYLLWITEVKTRTIRGRPQRGVTKVPSQYVEYIALSWSWASIDGRISLTWFQHNYDPRQYLTILEDAEVTHNQHKCFGRVLGGYLKFFGPIAFVLWQATNNPYLVCPMARKITHIFPKHFKRHMAVPTPRGISTDHEMLFDTVLDDLSEELVLLPITGNTKRSAHENEVVIGPILKHSADGEDYVRIGFFYTLRPQVRRILRNMPQQSITIY